MKWVKTTEYGDYRDPQQNHKFDHNEVSHYTTIAYAQRVGVSRKHAGSKPTSRLKKALRKVHMYGIRMQNLSSKGGNE